MQTQNVLFSFIIFLVILQITYSEKKYLNNPDYLVVRKSIQKSLLCLLFYKPCNSKLTLATKTSIFRTNLLIPIAKSRCMIVLPEF